ncbi:MAG TPA: flagellar basal body-associated FliL family protein [Nevskiaceae bacterium]|nr:flagellar basal body-associated FliL family protein [Nevskiaceae bacterium]
MASAAPVDADTAAPAAPAKGKGGGLVAMLVPVVLSVVLSSGMSFFLAKKVAAPAAEGHGEAGKEGEHGEEKEAEVPKAANYVPFDPAFVVNLGDPVESRFLQVQLEAMTRDPLASEAIKAQAPRIRSALLMLFGAQKPADLTTREGKEKLQADVLAEMQKVMQEETGKPSVDAVYFTSFVMQ